MNVLDKFPVCIEWPKALIREVLPSPLIYAFALFCLKI